MDMIEVDPKLFVTCRLCLEDMGQYQIVPSVQQQIKYCFDIDVELFDGLPQLICVKCRGILNNFFTIKQTFCEKQKKLRSKILNREEFAQPQQDTVSSSQGPAEVVQEEPESESVLVINQSSSKKKRVLYSGSSSEADLEQPRPIKKIKKKKVTDTTWEADYKKLVVCKFCDSTWTNKKSMASHSRIHYNMKKKYNNVFKKYCTINLEKIDHKPNITGMTSMIVHDRNKIIDGSHYNYYVLYSKDNDTKTESINAKEQLDEDSSDDDFIPKLVSKRKRRLLSKSSNETVIIESNSCYSPTIDNHSDNEEETKPVVPALHNVTKENDNQCINIDSSDSDNDAFQTEPRFKGKLTSEAKSTDQKILQGIIAMCVKSYQKKVELDNDTENKKSDKFLLSSESQLKHKVLSIGRKIINKQGFNCTGLLRFMEHKNLEIVWTPKQTPYAKDCNYIRVMTKLRGRVLPDDNTGWINVSEDDSTKQLPSTFQISQPINIAMNTKQIDIPVTQIIDKVVDTAVLYVDANPNGSDLKKILNANPVANPKQLPKKATQSSNETVLMPIITATTSLAGLDNDTPDAPADKKGITVDAAPVTSNAEMPVPRIKVKPASELMSERTLNSLKDQSSSEPAPDNNMLLNQVENIWPKESVSYFFVPNTVVPQVPVSSAPLQIVQLPILNVTPPAPSETNTRKQDYVILDTVELPNKRTNSPFDYLKTLLQMHDITLLDPCSVLSADFVCLIRFRALFKQNYQNRPIILGLSLLCSNNVFCLKIRDEKQVIININKVSANWQWEILQIYKGEVVGKVLENAQKMNQKTYEYTYKFFCLLKSIVYKKNP